MSQGLHRGYARGSRAGLQAQEPSRDGRPLPGVPRPLLMQQSTTRWARRPLLQVCVQRSCPGLPDHQLLRVGGVREGNTSGSCSAECSFDIRPAPTSEVGKGGKKNPGEKEL